VGDKLRVGIISANWGVAAHLPAWRAVPGVEVVGICTAHRETAEAAAAANGIPKAFWDYREMAQDPEIDLVDAGTRPNLRYDMCLSAIEAGKHVYNGIPFADTIEHARDLRDAAAKAGVVAAVDAYSEHLPAIAWARELIAGGELGQVFSVNCRLHMSLFNTPVSTFGYNWFCDRIYGCSAWRNLGSHALHVLYSLFGAIDEVTAHNEKFLDEWRFVDTGHTVRPQVEDTAAALLRFRSGAIGTLTTSWVAIAGGGYLLDVFGSKGRLVLQGQAFMPSNDLQVLLGKPGDMVPTPQEVPERFRRREGIAVTADDGVSPVFAMSLTFADVLRAIEHGGEPRPSFDQGYAVQSVIEAGEQSARTGRPVRPRDV